MVDKVKPLKLESPDTGGTQTDEYPTSLNPAQDFVELAGIVIDDATHRDETTQVWRADLDMMFKDGNNPAGFTLTQLSLTGGTGVPATHVGQVLISVNGTTFAAKQPLTSLSSGWLINNLGYMLVSG